MKKKFLWIFPAIILILSGAAQAWAVNSYVSDIPNGSKFSCDTCHVDTNVNDKRNDFGVAFKNNSKTWNASLASLDSDSDGYTNGTELQDPNGTWVKGQPNPGNTSLVSNPGDAGSVPPAQTYSISGTVSGAIQAGVTMTLTGSSSGSTTTGASGNYSFTGLSNGSYTVTPGKTSYTFSPARIQVAINNANEPGINFTASGAGACDNWSDVIDKYNDYVEGQAVWSEVIDCYNEYVAVHP